MGIKINEVTAKDGTKIMELHVDDKVYRMNSIYKPYIEAEKYLTQLEDLEQDSLLIVFGYGNGIFPNAIWNRFASTTIIFYEPGLVIRQYAEEQGLLDDFVNRKNSFFVSPDFSNTRQGFYSTSEFPILLEQMITYTNYEKIKYLALPKYREIFAEEYQIFEEQVQYRIKKLQANMATAKKMGHDAVVNNIINLTYVPDSYCADSFVNIFPKDMPAIIVSSGPSLEKNVHYLQDAKGHALILCVDTAVKYLLNENVVPDIIVSEDPKIALSNFDDSRIAGIPVLGSLDMNYQVLEKMKGSKVIFASTENTYVQNLYKIANHKINRLRSGGSVSTLSFSLCIYWGFRRIILIGQDLALTGNQMYAGQKEFSVNDVEKEILEVEDVNGNKIFTYSDYYSYLKWLEQEIVMYPEVEIIDATEGGAKIRGTHIMTFRDALKQYANNSYNVTEQLYSIPSAFNKEQKKMVTGKILDSVKALEILQNKLVQVIKLTKRAGKEEAITDNKRCIEIDREIQGICEYYDKLDEGYVIQREIDATELETFMAIFEQKQNETKQEQYEKLHAYFECLLRATNRVYDEWKKLDKDAIVS